MSYLRGGPSRDLLDLTCELLHPEGVIGIALQAYLANAAELCWSHGTLLVLDDVQAVYTVPDPLRFLP
jgi:acetylornithine/succinyldiaminopimelate/putrescine aminotransferase